MKKIILIITTLIFISCGKTNPKVSSETNIPIKVLERIEESDTFYEPMLIIEEYGKDYLVNKRGKIIKVYSLSYDTSLSIFYIFLVIFCFILGFALGNSSF